MKVKNGKSASVEDGAVAINTDPPPPKPKGAPRSCRPQSFAHSQSSGVTIFDNKIETRAVTIKTTALTTIPKLRIPTLSPFMHRHKDEHKCWKSIAVKAIFCRIFKYKDNYKYKYKNLRLHIRMAAITQNCKEAAAGARLLGEIKQTKEKL